MSQIIRSEGLLRIAVTVLSLTACVAKLHAATIYVPNSSFELPVTTFADPQIDSWQKSPKPDWYDESGGYAWSQLTGVFLNTSVTNLDHIDNCDGNQGMFLFAVPQVALYQDFSSTDRTNSVPSHAFNAKFTPGNAYTLTVGVIGGGGGMANGASLELSLYYRDASSNLVTVATTNITFSSAIFSNTTHFIDFSVQTPAAKSSDPWAGQNIGVQLLSTAAPNLAGGYWDLDNVRLTETIPVPNGSFELPVTTYADPQIDSWQKTPKPAWYDESGGYAWAQLTGVFLNSSVTNVDHIDNSEGNQALFLFAVPQVALFQDYDSVGGTNATPTHAFDAIFEVGKAYALTVGVIAGGGGMTGGANLEVSLYYREGATNRTTVAATNVTYSSSVFSNNTHFIDFTLPVPVVKASDPWAGQHVGIQFMSAVGPDQVGGYWDLENVRLSAIRGAALMSPGWTNGQFSAALQSEPGLRFEIMAATNLASSASNWVSLGTVTNVTGSIPIIDPGTNAIQRFYRAVQVP